MTPQDLPQTYATNVLLSGPRLSLLIQLTQALVQPSPSKFQFKPEEKAELELLHQLFSAAYKVVHHDQEADLARAQVEALIHPAELTLEDMTGKAPSLAETEQRHALYYLNQFVRGDSNDQDTANLEKALRWLAAQTEDHDAPSTQS